MPACVCSAPVTTQMGARPGGVQNTAGVGANAYLFLVLAVEQLAQQHSLTLDGTLVARRAPLRACFESAGQGDGGPQRVLRPSSGEGAEGLGCHCALQTT